MGVFARGRYQTRFADTRADVLAAQTLRARTFRGPGAQPDADAFDAQCLHVMIEDARTQSLACCFRLIHLQSGAEIGKSYSAQFYDLSALEGFSGPIVEMGRFCIAPEYQGDADILRVAWGAMAKFVDAHDVELLFGCSSFQGAEAEAHLDALALLRERHLAPKRWLPRVKAPRVIQFAKSLRKPDLKAAQRAMPPLLRSYLAMGGWVSDHAVVDTDLNTLHVFTGLEIKGIPPARARLLRAI
ncbi:putative hemolysin [Rubricella aquisinus]|uniref:L-ornithine N(alpha)-acyltransferase n=1 Tax=Rubricella aquisinus TaxID=2028108 RepID=A0A840WZ02_9RHOB|nr:GNAT family N-acetyltransferase [Rubricella aquisinus]MBB5516370.1 putative hemolysin [Rubricella aquisinus]